VVADTAVAVVAVAVDTGAAEVAEVAEVAAIAVVAEVAVVAGAAVAAETVANAVAEAAVVAGAVVGKTATPAATATSRSSPRSGFALKPASTVPGREPDFSNPLFSRPWNCLTCGFHGLLVKPFDSEPATFLAWPKSTPYVGK
jgi:hypothetical protein